MPNTVENNSRCTVSLHLERKAEDMSEADIAQAELVTLTGSHGTANFHPQEDGSVVVETDLNCAKLIWKDSQGNVQQAGTCLCERLTARGLQVPEDKKAQCLHQRNNQQPSP